MAYFEDARNALLADRGAALRKLQGAGFDLQVVHYAINWHGPVGWDDDLAIRTEVTRIGTSSFTLRYGALVGGEEPVDGEAVYVTVDRSSGRAVPIPELLCSALKVPAA